MNLCVLTIDSHYTVVVTVNSTRELNQWLFFIPGSKTEAQGISDCIEERTNSRNGPPNSRMLPP